MAAEREVPVSWRVGVANSGRGQKAKRGAGAVLWMCVGHPGALPPSCSGKAHGLGHYPQQNGSSPRPKPWQGQRPGGPPLGMWPCLPWPRVAQGQGSAWVQGCSPHKGAIPFGAGTQPLNLGGVQSLWHQGWPCPLTERPQPRRHSHGRWEAQGGASLTANIWTQTRTCSHGSEAKPQLPRRCLQWLKAAATPEARTLFGQSAPSPSVRASPGHWALALPPPEPGRPVSELVPGPLRERARPLHLHNAAQLVWGHAPVWSPPLPRPGTGQLSRASWGGR